jgi:hypothetical protein
MKFSNVVCENPECDEDTCKSCCPHDDLDHGICISCQKDLNEHLGAAAFDRSKAVRRGE